MTAEEMKRRKLAVENMYRLYEKYYPLWVKKKEEEAPAESPAPPAPSAEEVLLTEIRDLLKNK